jgi:spermidine synthase
MQQQGQQEILVMQSSGVETPRTISITGTAGMPFTFSINPRKIASTLAVIAVLLAGVSILGEYVTENVIADQSESVLYQLIDLSSVNAEGTLPTWYSTMLLLMAAVLLAAIAFSKQASGDRYRFHWTGLSLIFLYLSIDEGIAIHEIFSDGFSTIIEAAGYLTFPWIIAGIPLVIVFALLYLHFLLHLPALIRNLFIVAGMLYVGGAVVIEAISANQYDIGGGVHFFYLAIATVEELFEMLGVVVLIYALLTYINLLELEFNFVPALPSRHVSLSSPEDSHQSPLVSTVSFIAGGLFMLTQWLLLQEFRSAGWDLPSGLLVAIVATVAGVILGINFRHYLRSSWLTPSAGMMLLLHLTLPLWFPAVSMLFAQSGLPFHALFLFALCAGLALISFYTVFLNGFVRHVMTLPGLLFGVFAILILAYLSPEITYLLYATGFLLLLLCLGVKVRTLTVFAVVSVCWIILLPDADQRINDSVLAQSASLPPGTKTLFSGYSPFQKVDVLQTYDGDRYLLLNGQAYTSSFDSIAIYDLLDNLLQPDNAVLIGSGIQRPEFTGNTTIIEVDSVVAGVAALYFPVPESPGFVHKRIIGEPLSVLESSEQTYDLVVIDTPAVLNTQTTALYSVHLFEVIAGRMSEKGIVVTSLLGPFETDQRIARQIASSLLSAYEKVMVVTPVGSGWSFALAGHQLPFDRNQLSDVLRESGISEFIIFDTFAVQAIAGNAQPIVLD